MRLLYPAALVVNLLLKEWGGPISVNGTATCTINDIGSNTFDRQCEYFPENQTASGLSTTDAPISNQTDLEGNTTESTAGTESNAGTSATMNGDKSLYNTIRFYAVGVYTPIVMAFGIIGNSLTLVVLAKGVIRSTSTVYLIGLATSDILYLSAVTPYTFSAYEDLREIPTYKSFYSYYVVGVIPLIEIFYSISTWTTVSFSFERYIAVCHPMKVQQWCTTRRARLAVVCVYIICFLFGVPSWFSRGLVAVFDDNDTFLYHAFKRTEFGMHQAYLTAQYWFFFVSLNGIPLSLLAFFNISIVVNLRSARRYRKEMTAEEEQTSKSKSRDRQITYLLIGIVCVHFICSITAAACSLAVGFVGRGIYQSSIYTTVVIFANVLSQTNPVLNFLLYANCSKAMRKAMKDLFIPKRQRKTNGSGSVATTDTKVITMATIGEVN